VWSQGDDALDIDQAYSGTIDNAVVVLGDISDHAFEVDGPEGTGSGAFTLLNVTIIGNATTANGEYADYRSNAQGNTSNIYAFGFKDSSDVELNSLLTFGAWEIVLPTGVTNVEDVFANKAETVTVTDFGSTATAVTEGSQTVGAITSNFSWTYANTAGGLGF
jgi:hypothetical protein